MSLMRQQQGMAPARLKLKTLNDNPYDTLAVSRRYYGNSLPNHQLQTVAAACGYNLENHHHALADAEACAHIAMKLL